MLELQGNLKLDNGTRIAVMRSGPARSLFSFILLAMAGRSGIDVQVDLLDPKDFSRSGPVGCNMCGGIISESLLQKLVTAGINLASSVVKRGRIRMSCIWMWAQSELNAEMVCIKTGG